MVENFLFFFRGKEDKETKEEAKNVLSSWAGKQVFGIIKWNSLRSNTILF
jgi:hypothetical protein